MGFLLIDACQSVILISHRLFIYLIVEMYTLVIFLGQFSEFRFFFFNQSLLTLVIKALSVSC